ncbi:TRAP transporter substrate-binding protein [Pelotomaculum isophthalicicum JI]|uniref:TRAP transporter substrate-binding protein n=1 Tax=Pelotomaculum isophthalicicum JI TaxID=947010 RepID=A0A9X4JVQ0_9FIRM|nr:TRAP transporter substrate-binding protein [Pelotomaculum isophthalicicum]MDF9407798.1 TRAP transporter substrate-binding protein [Pelotomaculum isophthalicicum JI]
MKRLSFHRGGSVFSRVDKRVSILLVLLLVFALAGCSSGSSTEQGKKQGTVELNLAHFFPATHPAETELIQPWAKAIYEATNGQVKIKSNPGETLLKADGIYDGVVSGVADIGLSCFSYTRGRFPVLEAFELPGTTYNNSKVASKVAWEGIKQLNPKEVQDTKLLMAFATGPGDLFTKVPVRSLEDLQGLEIRATGLSADTLKVLGANPVAMPQSDAYEALSKGVVKGNLSTVEVLKGWKHAEVTQYLTRTPFLYNTVFFVTMNLNKWNSLSPENQKIIEDVSKKYFEEVAISLWDKQDEAALKYAFDEKGMKEIKLSDQETSRWVNLVKPMQDNFVKKMNEKGFQGQQIMDTVKALADKYNQEYK